MRIKYKGKFKEDLNEYINDQPWMFELDGNNQSFWELPICMQWGVIVQFSEADVRLLCCVAYSDHELKKTIERFQEWYNDNKQCYGKV